MRRAKPKRAACRVDQSLGQQRQDQLGQEASPRQPGFLGRQVVQPELALEPLEGELDLPAAAASGGSITAGSNKHASAPAHQPIGPSGIPNPAETTRWRPSWLAKPRRWAIERRARSIRPHRGDHLRWSRELHALAVARTDQAGDIERAHPPPRRMGEPDQERREPPFQLRPPVSPCSATALLPDRGDAGRVPHEPGCSGQPAKAVLVV